MSGLGEPDYPRDDETYAPPTGVVSQQLADLRGKITNLQLRINAADLTMDALLKLQQLMQLRNAGPEDLAEIEELIEQGRALRVRMAMTSDAVNLGAQTLNAMGVRMPVLSTQLAGIQIPIGAFALTVAGAVGVGMLLTNWYEPALAAVERQLIRWSPTLTPEQKNEAIMVLAAARQKASEVNNPITTAIKWAIIGAGVFFAYKLWKDR